METRFNHLTYAICNIANDLYKIDFSQVGQSSAGTVRRSLDDTLVTPSQTLTHQECLELMSTPEWSEPIPEE
jgi:hypothetical protein